MVNLANHQQHPKVCNVLTEHIGKFPWQPSCLNIELAFKIWWQFSTSLLVWVAYSESKLVYLAFFVFFLPALRPQQDFLPVLKLPTICLPL